MSFTGWFRSGSGDNATVLTTAEEETAALQHTLEAAEYIMRDDPASAERLLAEQTDAFHKQGLGVVTFLRATIGFEKEVMAEAGVKLAEAESAADEGLRRALNNPNLYKSEIYPEGAMYMVGIAQARNLSAIVGVLNESVTEAIKGFLKLRKAYMTLSTIVTAEEQWLDKMGIGRSAERGTLPAQPSSSSLANGKTTEDEDDDDDDDDFYEADDNLERIGTNDSYLGKLEQDGVVKDMTSLSISHKKPSSLHNGTKTQRVDASAAQDDPTADYITHPMDIYVHTAAIINFGIMLLIISIIPPAFSKLLSLVGFKGDRERGLRMLWRATNVPNINGAIAALVLLAYYNTLASFWDFMPEKEYPRARCDALLDVMVKRYPGSRFWSVEVARTYAATKQLEKAVDLFEEMEKGETQMKQVEALQWFEKALDCLCLHLFDKAAEAYIKCCELNSWSHGLYYYIAGSALLEKYRLQGSEADAEKAEELFLKVPANVGKKRFMGRGLPFDDFISRKISKWQARADERGCRLADAAGVSPLEEMIFFWGGYARMQGPQLEACLENLKWNDDESRNKHWSSETTDEKAILGVLRGTILRRLGRTDEARAVLTSEVVDHKWDEFKKGLQDTWPAPISRYEIAVSYWIDSKVGKGHEVGVEERELLVKSKDLIAEVARWDHYDLEARFGMKVTTARNTVNRFLGQ